MELCQKRYKLSQNENKWNNIKQSWWNLKTIKYCEVFTNSLLLLIKFTFENRVYQSEKYEPMNQAIGTNWLICSRKSNRATVGPYQKIALAKCLNQMGWKCKLGVYFMVSEHKKLNRILICMIGCVWTFNLPISNMDATKMFLFFIVLPRLLQ